ncbi:ArsA family ATPase [Natronobacterium gregoryi]|uniref:Arsenic-transporting ATPase n=2 Tax=Natronobacterium gregoryi TaxID=44930 RepID=L0AHJ5_NATGS|nr:TRC40/GET3/ArsA family transport-energizing ATPase [Natronobacterium gregoryi]AFZ72919.1 arsenite-activated ATPase ArsA [Natronobacterium gregoryi SP2]ELY69785.1 arsenite-activated ATPase ArsA [Natronobacterium gregoryi SP2]PLK21853.1 arsenic-transporting ATPase [Natronobacterium gregoryi SP2]SFI67300.1 arsenite efflux ATP-binding protein ArsA [Natronobacterium gregoryi]
MTTCLFYGGKGGVGKTTCAAATALSLADAGYETLVVSTDPAHSLADSLEIDLGPEPAAIGNESFEAIDPEPDATTWAGELWAAEIDPDTRAKRYEKLAMALAADLRRAGIRLTDEEVERIFAAGTPAGGDELAALDLLVEYVEADRWDVVVFDTAPTGHTLRLFDTPEVMGLALETTRSLRGQVRRIGTAARTAVLGPMSAMANDGDDEDDLAAFQARLERARDLIVDPDRTEFRVVTVPEGMAIAETQRLVAQLREDEVPVERLVVNRVLEDATDGCSRCESRRQRHEERVAEIRERFPDLAVVTLPELEEEVQGLEAVWSIAEQLPAERRLEQPR